MSDAHRTGCGCPVCMGIPRYEYEARCMGEQGPDADELELDWLRSKSAALEAKVRALEECLRLANQSTLETAEYVTETVRAEREECARLADSAPVQSEAKEFIAAAIRARGK